MKNKNNLPELREEYNKIKKKYDLVDFDILNKEFELEVIERKDFPLKQIRRRIIDRLVIYCKILEEIIFPSGQNPLVNYEIRSFTEEERKEFVELHKRLMVYERQSLLLNINSTEEEEAIFIKKVVSELPEFKAKVIEVVKKMQNSWKEDLPEEDQPYFG